MELKEPPPKRSPGSVCSPSALAWASVPRAQRVKERRGRGGSEGQPMSAAGGVCGEGSNRGLDNKLQPQN